MLWTSSSELALLEALDSLHDSAADAAACRLTLIICIFLKNRAQRIPNEFRPISLLPILSKVLEKHFHSLISDHISEHSPLSNCQWGFQPGKSTVAALLSTTQDWFQLLEKGKEVGTVSFDFHKAFDTVSHQPSVDKLCQLGLNSQIVK